MTQSVQPRRTVDLRHSIAQAIHRYDQHHALSTTAIPNDHHYGEADAVLAVLGDQGSVPRLNGLQSVREQPIVAYRDPNNPSVLLCRQHGQSWHAITPLTAEDLPDGGICTFGRLSSNECGRDVLILDGKPQPECAQCNDSGACNGGPCAHPTATPRQADYDCDPEALAWARRKVQDEIDRCRHFHASATEAGKPEQAEMWRRLANHMQRTFIGEGGCVIARFDERLPAHRRPTGENSS